MKRDPDRIRAWQRRSQETARQRQRERGNGSRDSPSPPPVPRSRPKPSAAKAARLCGIEGCQRAHFAKGLCNTHYYRLRRTGTTDLIPPRARTRRPVEYRRQGQEPPEGRPRRRVARDGRVHLIWSLKDRTVIMVERSPTQQERDEREAEVRHLHGQGLNQGQIGKAMGLHPATVSRIEERLGLREFREKPKRRTRGDTRYERAFRWASVEIHKRSFRRCEVRCSPWCSGQGVHVHHRKMRSQRGDNELVNLIDTCPECHRFIHAQPRVSYARGWLVHTWQDPAQVPWRAWTV